MPSLIDLVRPAALRALAGAVEIDHGAALARDGAVRITLSGPLTVAARVDGTPPAATTLAAAGPGLRFSCTCAAGRAGAFCAHLVATARVTRMSLRSTG
jgi:uncharacterized Zn finger protein